MTRRAFITGAGGQDGTYLVDLLLAKGYEVHGLVLRPAAWHRFHPHRGDLRNASRLATLLRKIKPDEIYNLASTTHAGESYEDPLFALEVDGLGAIGLLDAARSLRRPPRIFQAGSSEMFDAAGAQPRTESSPFRPRSPYGAAKLLAYWQGVNFRKGYGFFVVNGLLFDHESPLRSARFVTRQITRSAARIKLGLQKRLRLGSLDVRRDWGFAGDYVEAMWRTLQGPAPDDYVIASGRLRSLREFCDAAFRAVGLDWKRHVEVGGHPEADGPRGHASKARRVLKWKPRVTFQRMVAMMVECDLALACAEVR